jgi:hypothetical protein
VSLFNIKLYLINYKKKKIIQNWDKLYKLIYVIVFTCNCIVFFTFSRDVCKLRSDQLASKATDSYQIQSKNKQPWPLYMDIINTSMVKWEKKTVCTLETCTLPWAAIYTWDSLCLGDHSSDSQTPSLWRDIARHHREDMLHHEPKSLYKDHNHHPLQSLYGAQLEKQLAVLL